MNKKLALILFILSLFCFIKPVQVFASSFSNSYVRLDNQQSSAPLSGTVCAEPSSGGAGTENSVTIAFPSDFTLSTNPSNWTTNVANLPAGTTPWTGIGSPATSISGRSVTFASSDLISNLLYCFNFSAASSTTGASADNNTGTITTKNSSNSTIDFSDYAVSIINNDQIGISASIAPQISDLPITIESLTPGTEFNQDSTISYKITYGSNTTGNIPLTIQAEWSQGTIEGSPSPSVDILDYVVGSATNAYGTTAPVIDTVNRTITWTINSFPGNTTSQTVTFSLKTNDSYTGSNLVDFTVAARASSDTTVTPDQDVDQKYLYLSSVTPTPTPTSSPTQTSATTTPTPAPSAALAFTEISIRSVSESDAKIFVSTNSDASLNVKYGISINSLTKKVKTTTLNSQNLITLSGLLPDTDYYFIVTATDGNGNSVTSDIFTFKTAVVSQTPNIVKESLIVTSNNNIIINSAILQALKIDKNIIVIPRSTVFEIQFALDKNIPVKSIQAIVRNANVLGFSTTDTQDASSNFTDLTQIQPGVYAGKLKSQDKPGLYEIYVRIIDYDGNISEQKIADLKVTSKFQIFKKGTENQGVENVRALLYLYNPETKIYELISPQVLPIQNPTYSNPDGSFNTVLPYGKYRADLSNIGYQATTIEFTIDPYSGGYPTVFMKEEPFNVVNAVKYYWEIFTDALSASQAYIISHADSSRLFDLSAVGVVFVFILISILSISARTHISVFYLPYFLIFKLTIMFKRNKSKLIFGKVVNSDSNLPVSRANVYLTTPDGEKVIANLKTNKLGEFYYNNTNQENYKIKIVKEGFTSLPAYNYKSENKIELPIVLPIKKQGKPSYSLIEIILIYSEDIFGMCMEAILLLGLLLQIYSVFTFGLLRIAPFIIITILNFILIFTYLYKPKGLKGLISA